MYADQRRASLWEVLRCRRHDTVPNLSVEFGVSQSTIRRDIKKLSLVYPIYMTSGRYGGGVWVLQDCHRRSKSLTPVQADFLKRIQGELSELDEKICQSILSDFAPTG